MTREHEILPTNASTIENRHVLLVLGMHRSGTSSVAGVLGKIYQGSPKTLYGMAPSNLMGHWESEPIFRFNDRLLEARGRHWDDWRPVPNMDREPVYTLQEMEEAVDLLESEYVGVRVPVVKDPRMCRLAPFWLEAFRRWGGRVSVVMPLRSPLEVAQSLKARDPKPTLLIAGLHMWLGHILEAETATRGLTRHIFTWDDFLKDWRGVIKGINNDLSGLRRQPTMEQQIEIDQFLRPDLRHHAMNLEDTYANPLVHKYVVLAYEAMLKLVSHGDTSAAHAQLDEVRGKFEETSDHFYRLYAEFRAAVEGDDGWRTKSDLESCKLELEHARATVAKQADTIKGYQQLLSVRLQEKVKTLLAKKT